MNHKNYFSHIKPKGEPFIWLTAAGLAIGLLMVFVLFSVIVFNGLTVFWPKKVIQAEWIEKDKTSLIAGEISKKQNKTGIKGQNNHKEEWQFFVGNKDIYGYSFKFIDRANIKKISTPESLILLERLEYGDAIGTPLFIEKGGGLQIKANQKEFSQQMSLLMQQSHSLWQQVHKIEKNKIGSINRKLEKIRLNQINSKKNQYGKDEALSLKKEYESYSLEAKNLRSKLTENRLIYQLVTGEKVTINFGQIVDFYYPNKLSFFERMGRFLSNIKHFIIDSPREANTEGGVFPAIFGTFVMTVMMSLAVTPLGILAAIYLREYAQQGWFVRCVRISVNNLAGVPSIVFGVFGLGFFIYFIGGSLDQLFFSHKLPTPTFGTGGIFWASLTLALMTVPVVIVATEEALSVVPRQIREGSLACGASKWQTIQHVLLPASAPGILTGLILAMARGAGEVAPLMLVGVVKLAPSLPIDTLFPFVHLERKFMHLGFHIYDLGFQSPDSEAAKPMVFATTLLLIILVVVLNLSAILIRERLRKKMRSTSF